MRHALLAALLAALVLAAVPPAGADHPDPKKHFTLTVLDLEPGETHEVPMIADEGPLREGWVMLFVGGVVGDPQPLQLALALPDRTVDEWTWTSGGGAMNLHTLSLPETSDHYVVTLTNGGDETLRFFFYFDQSCNCLAKPVLPLAGAYSIFNFQFYKGETAWFSFKMPENVDLRYQVAVRDGTGGAWPDDFRILAEYPKDALPNGTMTWKVEKDRMYYMLLRTTPKEGFDPTPGASMILPRVAVSHEEERGVPAPAAGLAALALAAAALAVRRRR